MAKFHFQNHQDEDLELVIEPWAVTQIVSAGAMVEFEVNDSPPPEIEFCITEKGKPYIYVMSERVRICINGRIQEFTTRTRPPLAEFRILRKILWS
jgi:hypothetical protein